MTENVEGVVLAAYQDVGRSVQLVTRKGDIW